MNREERRSSTRIRLVRSSASAGVRGVIDAGVEQGPGECHQQGGRDALPGDVRDEDARDRPTAQPEEVEEVAADSRAASYWLATS